MSFNEVFQVIDSGSIALVAGTVAVANANILLGDLVMVQRTVSGGTAGILNSTILANGTLNIYSALVGTNGFNNADTSTVKWIVLRQTFKSPQ